MLAIYGRKTDPQLAIIRSFLLRQGIPCILIGPEFGFASVAYRVPFVAFADGSEPFGCGIRQKLLPDKLISFPSASPQGIADTLRVRYVERFGCDMDFVHEDGIRFAGRQVYFRAHLIHLTGSEYRIVRFLFHSRGCRFTGDEIAAACLPGVQSGAAVHICNINSKAMFALGMPLIETRRYSGYRIV